MPLAVQDGSTPLHYAAAGKTASLLLESKGIDIEAKNKVKAS
jgi:hypothetical protein